MLWLISYDETENEMYFFNLITVYFYLGSRYTIGQKLEKSYEYRYNNVHNILY